MKCISLCHTVVTEMNNGQLIYNAGSPDELALINFAKFVGSFVQYVLRNTLGKFQNFGM